MYCTMSCICLSFDFAKEKMNVDVILIANCKEYKLDLNNLVNPALSMRNDCSVNYEINTLKTTVIKKFITANIWINDFFLLSTMREYSLSGESDPPITITYNVGIRTA